MKREPHTPPPHPSLPPPREEKGREKKKSTIWRHCSGDLLQMDLRNGHGQTLGAIRGARFQAQWSALRRNCVHPPWKPPVRLNMPTSASCDTPRRACKSLTAPSPPQWYPFRLLKVLRSLKSIRSFSVKKNCAGFPWQWGHLLDTCDTCAHPSGCFIVFFPSPVLV